MKKLFAFIYIALFFAHYTFAQEYFNVSLYQVNVRINKDASLDIDETIDINFSQERHGIFRRIPIRYTFPEVSSDVDQMQWQMKSEGDMKITVVNIEVKKWEFTARTEGDFKVIKIGSINKFVNGNQQYKIHYRILNAVLFFETHSELCLNIIGDGWPTTIDKVNYRVELPDSIPTLPDYFVSTGIAGSTANHTSGIWENNRFLYGTTTQKLSAKEGVTIGIKFPKDFLTK